MNKIIRIPLVLIFMFFAFGIYGQENDSTEIINLSIEQAREYALEHNYNIKNSELDVQIAKKKVWETTAIGLPQANAKISYQNYPDIPTQLMPDFISQAVIGVNQGVFGLQPVVPISDEPGYFEVQFGQKHNATGEISVSQLIFSGEYIVGLQAAKVYKSLAKQNFDKTKNDVIEGINETYYMILMTNNNLKILKETIDNTKETYIELKKTFEAGMIEETNVDQLDLTVKNLENSYNNIKRQKEWAEEMLKFQMGMSRENKIILTTKLNTLFDSVNIEKLIAEEFVLDNHVDYKLLNTQEQLSVLDLKREKATFLPTISAFFTHQQNAMRNEFNLFDSNEDWFPTTIVGGSINIPVFASGQKIVKVQQAKLNLLKTQNSKKMLEQNLEIAVVQAKSDLMTAYESYKNEKENLSLSKKIYNNYMKKFKQGMASSMELTQSQNQYLTNRTKYISAMVELLKAKNKLDKALNNYNY